jgi:hypothetical protein
MLAPKATLLRHRGLLILVQGIFVHLGKAQNLSHILKSCGVQTIAMHRRDKEIESVRSQRKHCRSKQYMIKQTQNDTRPSAFSCVWSPIFPLVSQNFPHVRTQKMKVTGMPNKKIRIILHPYYFQCWLTCLLGLPLTKLAPSSISAIVMRDALRFPIGRFCLIRVWIQLSCNTSVPVPRLLAVIWPPAGYIAWVLNVSDNEMGPPLGRETKSFLFAGVPWWLAYCFGDWAMTCVKRKKKDTSLDRPGRFTPWKKSEIKLCPRVPAYQLENQWCKNLEMLAIMSILHQESMKNKILVPRPLSLWTSAVFILEYPRCQNLYPVPQPPPKQSECRIRRPVFSCEFSVYLIACRYRWGCVFKCIKDCSGSAKAFHKEWNQ